MIPFHIIVPRSKRQSFGKLREYLGNMKSIFDSLSDLNKHTIKLLNVQLRSVQLEVLSLSLNFKTGPIKKTICLQRQNLSTFTTENEILFKVTDLVDRMHFIPIHQKWALSKDHINHYVN